MKPIKVTLLYYPPVCTHAAGHIALKVEFPESKSKLEYTERLSVILDVGATLTLAHTAQKFGEPIEYPLPPPFKEKDYHKVNEIVMGIKETDFSLFTNNCADAATKLLIELGYERISLSKFISTPSALKNQIEEHYCLQKKLNNIFEHKPWGKDEKQWQNVRGKLVDIFKLDGFRLKADFLNILDWKEIHNRVKDLIKENKSPRASPLQIFGPPETSERYKKLSDLLSVITMYAFPQDEALNIAFIKKNEEAINRIISSSYFF